MNDNNAFVQLASQVVCRDPQIFLAYDAPQGLQLMRMESLGGAVAWIDLDTMGHVGLALMAKLRERFPKVPIIAISSASGRTVFLADYRSAGMVNWRYHLGTLYVSHPPGTLPCRHIPRTGFEQ